MNTRRPDTYATHRAWQAPEGYGQSVEQPCEGYFRHKLRSGGVYGGVRIFYGPPRDPVTGEELDRSWRWQALFNDQEVDFDSVWPVCAGTPITEQEYVTYCNRQRWAEQNAPKSGYANPRKKIDPLSRNEPFPF